MALLHVNFFSDVLGKSTAMYVILPQRTNSQIGMAGVRKEGKYPVLYLLHGLSDDYTIWQRRTSIERYVADMGIAVVMPDADTSFYSDMSDTSSVALIDNETFCIPTKLSKTDDKS